MCGEKLAKEALTPSSYLAVWRQNPALWFVFLKKGQNWQTTSKTMTGWQNWHICDIFAHSNKIHLSLQGKASTVFKVADRISVFKAKFDFWSIRVERGVFDMFETYRVYGKDGSPPPDGSDAGSSACTVSGV